MDHRHELLILDAGPIRELVLFHAVEKFGFERLRTDLKFVKDPESYGRCDQFIASFRRKTTSASVVGELNHWIRQTERTGQERLWNRVYEEFRDMGMDEEVVRLVNMDIGLVTRFGPVDVSLIELARLHSKHNPIVLTIDHALYGECKQAGLRVRHVREVALMVR
jgi:hypothetical protein